MQIFKSKKRGKNEMFGYPHQSTGGPSAIEIKHMRRHPTVENEILQNGENPPSFYGKSEVLNNNLLRKRSARAKCNASQWSRPDLKVKCTKKDSNIYFLAAMDKRTERPLKWTAPGAPAPPTGGRFTLSQPDSLRRDARADSAAPSLVP